jgi:thiol-disulfide isomerase/thioredoxin
MKKLLYLIIITLISNIVNAQQFAVIRGTIVTNDSLHLEVFKPVNGFFNSVLYPSEQGPKISKTLNNNFIFEDSVKVNTFCFVRVRLTAANGDFITKSDVLVFPNDTVEFSYTTKDSTIKFNGNNAKGHELLYSTTDIPANISLPADNIINKYPDNSKTFVKELVNYANTLSAPFEKLLIQGHITQQYYQTVKTFLHLWPIQMAIQTLLFSTKEGVIIPQQTIDSTIEEIYKIYSPNYTCHAFFIGSTYYNNYLAFQAYKKHHFNSPKEFYSSDTIVKSQNGKQIKLDKEFVRFLYIEDMNTRQAEWGNMLTWAVRFTTVCNNINTIEQYEELNPSNNWSKIIRRQFALIEPEKPVSYKLTSPVVEIVDSVHSNIFKELVKTLTKSDFYFVDVWSSWCGPCVRAFRENDYIDSVLQINQITKIYLSIDKSKEAWKTAISKYALGGYNLIANESLIIDMKEMLGIDINSNFTIPKYLLLNGKGEFVKELYSPVTRVKLANQLKELVENK